MSLKWTGTHSQSETGILRKSEFKEKKEELFVFGYSCKLFRDDAKALHIDQGKHLIPWMGDETLKIDRYDARGALHDLARHEAPQGGFDWRVELTKTEHEVEQLCDDERYRALHTDEEEELMYKEEELKRLHKAGYGQVGFNYDTPAEPSLPPPAEDEEPFVPAPAFKELMPGDTVFPETVKQNAIIDKTSKFIASQGAQMEILIKAKQRDNPQFKFLNKDDPLHLYYTALTALVKAGKWPEKKHETLEEKPLETDEYLHPSLSTVIESAPSIPSINYKPSADCDYTMLISKMRGDGELAPGELPPPGTEPAPAPPNVIARAPILYNTSAPPPPPPTAQQIYQQQQYAMYYQQYMAAIQSTAPVTVSDNRLHSTGLSLMSSYDSDHTNSESEEESKENGDVEPAVIPIPPDDVATIIDKMAAYVARNGDEFADIVRAKNDPRFTFLEPNNEYHAFYNKLMREKRGDFNGDEKKGKVPVSFSIKKLKEPDPILPKPALPYESSSDEDSDKTDKQTDTPVDKPTDNIDKPTPILVEKKEEKQIKEEIQITSNAFPPILVYKMDGQLTHNLPTVKTIEPLKYQLKAAEFKTESIFEKVDVKKVEYIEPKRIELKNYDVQNFQKIEVRPQKFRDALDRVPEKPKEPSPIKEKQRESNSDRERDSPEKRREKKRPREKRSKSESREREYKRSKSVEREKRRERNREREKTRRVEDDLESEIISLEDNSDDMIDLTGDQSDSKVEADSTDKAKQLERRRRAAEFLKKVGVDPSAASLPTNSLASAMVDTLESIRKKKAAEEEKRRRKEKRRRRERRDYEDDVEKSHRKSKRRRNKSSDDDEYSDSEAPKKKKRKKDKKSSKSKKKRRQSPEPDDDQEEDQPLPPNIDLSSTLKELRTNSPTKNLIIPDVKTNVADSDDSMQSESEGNDRYDDNEDNERRGKRRREYSDGENDRRYEGVEQSQESEQRGKYKKEYDDEENDRRYEGFEEGDRKRNQKKDYSDDENSRRYEGIEESDRRGKYKREYSDDENDTRYEGIEESDRRGKYKREYSDDENDRRYEAIEESDRRSKHKREYSDEENDRRYEENERSEESERRVKRKRENSEDKNDRRYEDNDKSEESERRAKRKREYSEGEWSSDSQDDSSDGSKRDDI